MRERLRSIGWVLLLVAVIGCFFHETLFSGFSLVPTDMLNQLVMPFGTDTQHVSVQNHYAIDVIEQFYPWGQFWQESVRHGHLPIWNPNELGGHPHAATSLSTVFNPVKLLYLVLTPERAFSLGVVLQFTLAGLLMFALLREVGCSRCAAWIGGYAFALNSAFVSLYWAMSSVALAPLVLWLFERSVKRNSPGYLVMTGVALGISFLSGNIQSAFHLGFLCVGYMGARVPWKDQVQRWRMLRFIACILAIGGLLAAVQWLPTMELIAHDPSRRVAHGGPAHSGLRPTMLGIPFLLTFFFPGLAGSTESFDLAKAFGATMGDFCGYIGLLPATAFLIGATIRDRRVRGLLLTASGVLVIIFFTPLIKYVYHRFLVVVVFAMAFVSGHGVDVLLEARPVHRRLTRAVLLAMGGLCVAIALGLVAVQWFVQSHWRQLLLDGQRYVVAHAASTVFAARKDWLMERVPLFLHHYRISNPVFWIPLATIPAVVLVWEAHIRGRLRREIVGATLIILTVCDLTIYGRTLMPQIDLQKYPLYPPLQVIKRIQEDPDLFRVKQLNVDSFMFLNDNILTAYGLSTVSGYESLSPLNIDYLPYRRNGLWTPVADLLNIKYVLVPDDITLPTDRFSFVQQSQGVRLYRNDRCLPRMQFCPVWKVVADREQTLAAMSAPTFEPRRTVFVETDPPELFRGEPSAPPMSQDATAKVEVEEYTPRRVRGRVHGSVPGVVLLADTFYPGWYATVDGAPTPIYRADYVMRAVFVTAGDHEIEFRYAPLSFRLGATISSITLAGLALMGLWLGMRRRMVRGLA